MVTALSILLGLIPSAVWLLFFLREDERHPEPKRLIFYVFFAGAFSTFIALALQIIFNKLAFSFGIETYSVLSLIFLAGIEELMKFGAVYFGVSKKKEFDEPIDAMIYMITAALGFAAVENVASIFQAGNGIEVAALRFVGATLLHSLSSGLIGYYWGRALVLKIKPRGFIIKGILLAIILHVVFNYLIIKTGPVGLVIVFLAAIGFFILNDFEKLKHLEKID